MERELAQVDCPTTSNMSGEEIESVLANISSVNNSVVPKSVITRHGQIPLPDDIVALIAAKKQLRRRLFRARHTGNETLLKSRRALCKTLEGETEKRSNRQLDVQRHKSIFRQNAYPKIAVFPPFYQLA